MENMADETTKSLTTEVRLMLLCKYKLYFCIYYNFSLSSFKNAQKRLYSMTNLPDDMPSNTNEYEKAIAGVYKEQKRIETLAR